MDPLPTSKVRCSMPGAFAKPTLIWRNSARSKGRLISTSSGLPPRSSSTNIVCPFSRTSARRTIAQAGSSLVLSEYSCSSRSKGRLRRMFRPRRDNKNMSGGGIPPAAVEYELGLFPQCFQPVCREFKKHGFIEDDRLTSSGAKRNVWRLTAILPPRLILCTKK